MAADGRFRFEVSGGEDAVAYLRLPTHPEANVGAVKKTVRLRDLIGDYKGPDIYLDFTDENLLIGLEILV